MIQSGGSIESRLEFFDGSPEKLNPKTQPGRGRIDVS
jgi:hypothetical protein